MKRNDNKQKRPGLAHLKKADLLTADQSFSIQHWIFFLHSLSVFSNKSTKLSLEETRNQKVVSSNTGAVKWKDIFHINLLYVV